MTIDYKALAGRIKKIADGYETSSIADGLREEIADLRTAVTMLNEAAEAKPVAWIDEFGNAFPLDAWKPAKRTGYLDYHKKAWKPLFTHPAPQPQPQPDLHCAHERFGVAGNVFDSGKVARPYGTDTMSVMGIVPMCDEPQPERQPLTNEQIDEIGEPFGYFTYGDAQGDKRRAFVRAIESSHGIGYGKAIEGGPSELRSCTCHPDDNPPVPCARQYALNECRAASEPTEAQIEAAAKWLDHHLPPEIPACSNRTALAVGVLRAALAARESK